MLQEQPVGEGVDEPSSETRAARAGAGSRPDVTRALLDLSHELARTNSVQEISGLAVEAIEDVLGGEAAGVLLWDAERSVLRVAATRGLPPDLAAVAAGFEMTPDDHPDVVTALDTPFAQVFSKDSRLTFIRDAMASFGVGRALAAPMGVRDRLFGFLAVVVPDGMSSDAEAVALEYLSGLADLTATALDVTYQAEQAAQRGEVASTLLDLARDLASLRDPDGIAERVARAVPGVVRADASAVVLVNEDSSRLRVAGLWGWPDDMVEAVRGFELGIEATPAIAALFERRSPMYVTAEGDDPIVAAILEEFGADRALVAPVLSRGGALGCVASVVRDGSAPDLDTVVAERVQGLADQAAIALDNARLFSLLESQVAALARSEWELREARDVLEHIVDSGPIVTFRGTTELFRITYVSGNIRRLAGYDPETFLGINWLDLVHPSDRDETAAAIERILTEPEVAFEMRFAFGDRRWHWVAVHLRVGDRLPGGHHEILGYVWDRTEQRQAEERYRAVSDLTSDVAYSYVFHPDGSGAVEWVSGAVERLTGYSPEEVQALGGWGGMIAPEDRPAYRQRVRELAQGATVTGEFRIVRKGGESAWLRIYGAPEIDEGRLVRIYGAAQDVTARREAEEMYRIISETVSDAAFSYHVDGDQLTLEWVTDAWERLSGQAVPDPVPGELFVPVAHVDDLEIIRGAEERVLRGEATIDEFRIVRPDGSLRWLRIYATPVLGLDGRVRRVYGAAQDVTERKEAEAALRDSEARLRGLVEASPVAITAYDSRGRVRLWNPAAERIFGWTADEVLGRRPPIVPPEAEQESWAMGEELFAGRRISNFETRRLRKDGSSVDVTLSSAPMVDPDGNVRGVMTVLADVSEQRELERQLQHVEKMGAIGRLAGGVAHDFNNLLTAILGNAEMLLEDLDDPDAVRDHAESIRMAGEQAAALTEQMLMFSRHQPLNAVVLDVNDAVQKAAALLARLVREDVLFEWTTASGRAWVRIPETQIEQVLLNLGVNARDAMPTGGRLAIEVCIEEARDDGSDGGRGEVVLRMTDTGTGMDEETARHAFEPFFTTKATGTGLGLAVVYGIVDAAGGTVTVDSRPGNGSTFEVRLPLAEGPVERTIPDGGPRGIGGRETVLLVEDEARVRSLARRALERQGYAVVEAVDGLDALAAVEDAPQPAVLVTDVVMPRLGGTELAGRLRRRWPDLRVVFISGYADLGDAAPSADAALAADGSTPTAYLQKPFTPLRLVQVVRGALDARVEPSENRSPRASG